jgi:outer membrane murein-binding lipoprotein Lpp
MTISKAHWNTEGEQVRLSMPFSKVDKERRTVSGFASLDNLDKQNDIVTPEASIKAFKKFRGNIREMHQPSAVGKMVSFKEDKYFDEETGKMYSGIYVTTYVSKGAQDAWEKVLDGTYTGFSIGGRMNKWDDAYDEKADTQIRIIKDYDLIELSLVDSPANQFANIMSVEKVDGVDVIKGDAVETIIENVFWDKESGIVMLSENESEVSPTTGNQMQNIGFVEKTDNEKTSMIKFLVGSAKGTDTSKIQKEENPMAKATKKTTEEIIEKTDVVVEDVQVAPEAEATVETAEVAKSDDVAAEAPSSEETAAPEVTEAPEVAVEEVAKSDSVVEEVVTEEVSKSDEVVADAVTEIKNTLTTAFSDLVATVKSLQEQVNAMNKSIDAVSNDVTAAKDEFNEFGKRVDAVEADTAFRKSGDLGEIIQEQPAMVEKSLWGGRFLKTADLFR